MDLHGERSKILVVCHDGLLLTMVDRATSAWGMTVIALLDGSRTIEVAVEEQPNLILLDMQIPGVDARDTLRDLKLDHRTERIPVFMFSGGDGQHDRRVVFELGADDYFDKPLDLSALMRRIVYGLEKARRASRPPDAVPASNDIPSWPAPAADLAVQPSADNDGFCEVCDDRAEVWLMMHVSSRQLRWLCGECRSISTSLWIPIGPTEIDRRQAEVLRPDRAKTGSRPPPPSRRPVLVVEDDRDIRDAICEALADAGLATLAASNGQEALGLLRDPSVLPSLILLDLMMPVMDGWELRRCIQADRSIPPTPIVVMSALPRDSRLGAIAWLQKPLGIGELLSTVREAVDS